MINHGADKNTSLGTKIRVSISFISQVRCLLGLPDEDWLYEEF